MRALLVNEYAHPSKIPLSTNVPAPIPDSEQVVVDIYSAGLNFFDVGGEWCKIMIPWSHRRIDTRYSKLRESTKASHPSPLYWAMNLLEG
jgi:hypothetical protein